MFTAERVVDGRTDHLGVVRRWFVAVSALVKIGTGMWAPLMLLFFTLGRGLSLAGSGTAVTVGGCAGLVFGTTVTWRVIDRIGPFRTKALAGVCNATAFIGYLITHNLAEVAAFSALAASAANLFLTADPEAVRRISLDEQRRVHTFALLT